jgi:hypothetical protein
VHTHTDTHHHVGGGAPVLDIGDDVGAVVALMDPSAVGTELFLRREGDAGATIHTGVWMRHQNGAHVTAALFCELTEGTYWVLDPEGNDRLPVDISGGKLAELDLRS